MTRKVDQLIQKETQYGKKLNQKSKSYVVLQYLLKYTDKSQGYLISQSNCCPQTEL